MIEISRLRKTYRGGRVAVDDVSFAVPAGSVCALLGPNGAGKTTTLRCLAGLARPTSGTAHVEGGRPGAVLDGFGLHPQRTGRDHLRMLATAAGLPGADLDALLARVGLDEADADRAAGEYSLGMARRLALASALLPQPQVLLLDEPENGLDPHGVAWLRDLLRAHAREGGAVLVSTHALAEVERVADTAVIVHRGRTVAAGTIDELGDLEQRYLEATAP